MSTLESVWTKDECRIEMIKQVLDGIRNLEIGGERVEVEGLKHDPHCPDVSSKVL